MTSGLGRDLVDDAQLVQRFLKEVGVGAELKIQEYSAYIATTAQGKIEGLARTPTGVIWEPAGCIAPMPLAADGHVIA